jgi:hypothetical protein
MFDLLFCCVLFDRYTHNTILVWDDRAINITEGSSSKNHYT